MATVAGTFNVGGTPYNGGTAKLWADSHFASPPVKDTALPAGSPEYGPVTTGTTYGADGAFAFTGVADGSYYVSIEAGGHRVYQAAHVVSTTTPVLTNIADISIEADTDASASGAIIFKTAGVVRGRITNSGTLDIPIRDVGGAAYNVMAYPSGAVGNNIADDTAAVQAKVDAIDATNDGGTLLLPPGYTFAMTEITLPVKVRRVSMYGATVRHSAVGAGFGLFSKLTAAGLGPFIVEGGTIEGNAGDALNVADGAFYFSTAALDAGTLGDTEWIIFRDVTFKNLRGFPIRGGWGHNILIDHCTFENCSMGPNIYTSRAVWVQNCEFNGQQYTGPSTAVMLAFNAFPYPADDTSDDQVRGVFVLNNYFRNIELHQSILFHGGMHAEVAGNTFEHCNAPISFHADGGPGSFQAHHYVHIHHNTMIGTDDYGDATTGDLHTHGTEVNFNPAIEISGTTDTPALRVHIDNNTIAHYGHAAEAGGSGDSAVYAPITSNGSTRELEIRDNLITDCYAHAIKLIGEHLDLRISGNTIRDILNAGGPVSGAGIRLLDTSPTGAVMSGWIRDNIFDTVNTGIAASQTTPNFSGLRVHKSNRFVGVTTPYLISTNANRVRTPRWWTDASPVDVDVSVTEYVMVEVNSALTINAPTNPSDGDVLSFQIYNPGSLGVITWNAVFHQPAFTNPGGGSFRSRSFRYEAFRSRWNIISDIATNYG